MKMALINLDVGKVGKQLSVICRLNNIQHWENGFCHISEGVIANKSDIMLLMATGSLDKKLADESSSFSIPISSISYIEEV